jgi:hypothetical protein
MDGTPVRQANSLDAGPDLPGLARGLKSGDQSEGEQAACKIARRCILPGSAAGPPTADGMEREP